MRILSLSFPLPGPCVDNYNFLSAPAFFDYDAVVVDPRAISQLVEEVVTNSVDHITYARERIVNGPSGPEGVGLAELLHNRADEAERLLARGGLVVCFAVPNVAQPGVIGNRESDRFSWLQSSGVTWKPPFLRRGAGTEFGDFETANSFGAMLHKVKARLAYQVYFEEHAAGCETAVIARSVGGAPIALAIAIGTGSIVLMPPPARPLDSHGRYQVSEALQQAVRQHLRQSSASSAPSWVVNQHLPGFEECKVRRDASAVKLDDAKDELTAADVELESFERLQRLLWDEGRGFDEAVRASLTVLGFRVAQYDEPGRIELQDKASAQRVALLETDSSEAAVGLDVHFRMRRRLEDALLVGTPCRGLIVISGYRRTPPEERQQQYTKDLKLAAEQLGYCLAESDLLFRGVNAALGGDSRIPARLREQLLTTAGVLQTD